MVNKLQKMERKNSSLLQELHKLKLENKRQSEIISSLKQQAARKDEDLKKLRKNVENDSNSNDDYCCYCQQLKCKIGKLEMQLAETIEKQHEAMTRAVKLAEKNRNLERELKDIDNMAMVVEEECQTKVKQNAWNVKILQEKISEKIDEIKILQSEIVELKSKLQKEKITVEKLCLEKKSLEKTLDDVITEKKCLNDKINHYITLERNLKIEARKLQEINRSLQRQVNDIQGKLGDSLNRVIKGKGPSKPKKKNPTLGLPSAIDEVSRSCHQTCSLLQDCKGEPVPGDVMEGGAAHKIGTFCCYEGHKLGETSCSRNLSNLDTCCHKINELEREIIMLKQENVNLKREKAILTKQEEIFCTSGDSIKITLDRLERERDLALSDVSKLQTERDILRERIKLSAETQIGENSRMERILLENEERIRRLESERRELISSQGSQRATLSALEEKCDEYKNQVFNLQTELSRSTTHYNQIKKLQEETDRALSEVHGRLAHTQTELNVTINKLKEMEMTNRELEDQISVLKKEKCALKSSITSTEREKDDLLINLDEKTELCSKLQGELKSREKFITELNEKISDLQRKFEILLTEKATKEHAALSLERDVEHLKELLDKCEKQNEVFKKENRRLQDDLASALKDCHIARRELDGEKKEVENLKRQLQQYVKEVKKAEELLFRKESERNEMLEHFRSLSIEATALESNNHSLESAVETTKVELTAANSRLIDLEQEVAAKESLVNTYENQIVDLTSRVADLEMRLKQEAEDKYRAQEDLSALRDLCSKIDEQKQLLQKQAYDSDTEKLYLRNEVQRLNDEYEGLNHKLTHERSVSQALEKSLSHSRQETLEHKISNKDLQSQVQQLKVKVEELSEKLENESQNVQKYQTHCADLSCQVSELRREVTNARFEKARALDANRRSISMAALEEVDEMASHESTEEEKSFRNVPRLVFIEDSERTISSCYSYQTGENGYSAMEYASLCHPCRQLENNFRTRTYPDSNEHVLTTDYLQCEGTSSELSSLPEDYISHCFRECISAEGKIKVNEDAENSSDCVTKDIEFDSSAFRAVRGTRQESLMCRGQSECGYDCEERSDKSEGEPKPVSAECLTYKLSPACEDFSSKGKLIPDISCISHNKSESSRSLNEETYVCPVSLHNCKQWDAVNEDTKTISDKRVEAESSVSTNLRFDCGLAMPQNDTRLESLLSERIVERSHFDSNELHNINYEIGSSTSYPNYMDLDETTYSINESVE